MCIRDSTRKATKSAGKRAGKPALTKMTLVSAKKRPASKACLLYTSDAADERSSVDLGGRRIIKKKKQHNVTARSCNINIDKQPSNEHSESDAKRTQKRHTERDE